MVNSSVNRKKMSIAYDESRTKQTNLSKNWYNLIEKTDQFKIDLSKIANFV